MDEKEIKKLLTSLVQILKNQQSQIQSLEESSLALRQLIAGDNPDFAFEQAIRTNAIRSAQKSGYNDMMLEQLDALLRQLTPKNILF